LKLVSYSSQSVRKTGTGVIASVQTGFGLYIFHPPLAQPMSRWSPNLQEGGDAATVSAKDETTENLSVGADCFAPDLGRKWRCPSRRRALFHRRRTRLPLPGPLTSSERSTVDSNGGISLFRVEDRPRVRLVDGACSQNSPKRIRHSASVATNTG
jgi:hypothetical protein